MNNVISIRENELDTQLTEAEYLISILEDKLSRLEADYKALQQEIIISNEIGDRSVLNK